MKSQLNMLLTAVALVFGAAAVGDMPRRAVDEASVTVAYLYNFGKFVEWPAAAFASSDVPMRFCFYGGDSLDSVSRSLEGKRAHGRPIEVASIKRGGQVADCHVLYIDQSERFYVRPLLELTGGMPILTVSEIDGFASAGGVIGLLYDNNKVKFEINATAAERARLRVSSQLLKLALQVFEERQQ